MDDNNGTTMKLERLRKFNTRDVYGPQNLNNDVSMVVKAGNRLFLRGQTGFDLNNDLVAPNDAAGQAEQAMENTKTLLEEAGSALADVCKVTTYLTDRNYREPVYEVVGRHLKGVPTAASGMIVKGLAVPGMKVELDIQAAIPPGEGHQRLRTFNARGLSAQSFDRESCMVVRTSDEIYLRALFGGELDGSVVHGLGRRVEDASAQTECLMNNARVLLEEAGSSLDDVCKLRVYIADRAYREAVYQKLGEHFGGVHPASTGLIMRGFARPEILVQVDMAVALSKGTPHTRLRKFETRAQYKDGQDLRCKFCMAVVAGDRVYLRGQTGTTLDGHPVGGTDPAAQTEQAMENIKILLGEAGASISDICQVTTYIADRAYREPVYRVMGRHLKGVHPVGTGLIVDGFANPRILVEIDVEAVIQRT